MNATSKNTDKAWDMVVPSAWVDAPAHLVVVAWPAPVGTRCDLTGDVETRAPGPRVIRFCEANELDLAHSLRRGALADFERAGVYRYDGSGYDKVPTPTRA